MKWRPRPLTIVLVAGLLLSVGCGISVRSPLSTGNGVTIPKSAEVKTADEARQIAIESAKKTLNSLDPRVIQVRLMVPAPGRVSTGQFLPAKTSDDPANLVWLVDVDQDGHDATPCPAPPPGIDQTICWYPDVTTSIAVSVMRGIVVAIKTSSPQAQGTPYAASIYLPQSAAIPTREDAMHTGFNLVPGQNGKPPTILEVRLLSATEWGDWLKQHGTYAGAPEVDPSTPIWEMEFVNAALAQGCTSSNTAGCVHDHLYLSLNAMTGGSLGFLFPAAGAPANYVP